MCREGELKWMQGARVMGRVGGFRNGRMGVLIALAAGMIAAAACAANAQTSQGDADAKRTLCVHGVASGSLNVRSGPGLDQPVIGRLGRNDCGLRLDGRCEGSWCEMAGPGTRGWVLTQYVGIYEIPKREPRAKVAQRKRRVASRPRRHPPPQLAVATNAARSSPTFSYWAPFGLLRTAARAVGVFSSHPRASLGSCVVGVASWDTLRIRNGPGVSHPAIGGIPSRACHVQVAGACRGPWCRVSWSGRVGWVNTLYLQ